MATGRTSRVLLHSMWLAVLSAVPAVLALGLATSALDHDPDFGRGWPAAGALFLILAPVWVPAVAVLGALIGLAAALSSRLAARSGLWLQVFAAAASGAAVGLLASAVWRTGGWQGLQAFDLAGLAIGAVSGGVSVLLAGRATATPGRSLRWGTAAAVLAAVTALGASWTWLAASHWDALEECAIRMGVDEAKVAVADRPFPPQSWCVTAGAVGASAPVWAAPALILALTATAVCALIAAGRWLSERPRPRLMVSSALVIVLLGVGAASWLSNPEPDPEALAQVRAELRNRPSPAATSSVPTAAPSTEPTDPPTASAAAVRELLDRLSRTAADAVADRGLWLQQPRQEEVPCDLPSGEAGILLTVSGRFSAQDPDAVNGSEAMAELSQANQALAQRIVDAWVSTGMLSEGDVIHGEWWLAGPQSAVVETAHVGFSDGIGELRIAGYCAAA